MAAAAGGQPTADTSVIAGYECLKFIISTANTRKKKKRRFLFVDFSTL